MHSRPAFWERYGARILLWLALVCAIVSVGYVAARVKLEDTRLTRNLPALLTEGWRAETPDGPVALAQPSRTEAGCLSGTLRLSLALPSSMSKNQSLCFQSKNEVVRVWVNDSLIYLYGKEPQRAYGHGVGAIWNIASLPESAAGGKLTVELTPIARRTGLAPYTFLLGARSDILSYLLEKQWVVMIAATLLLLVGLCALAATVTGLFRRAGWTRATLCFFTFVLLSAVWMLADSGLMQFVVGNKGVVYMLFGCSFYLLCSPFSLFMAETFPARARLFRGLSAVNSLYALLRISLYMAGVMDFETGLWILHLMMGCTILCINLALWLPVLRTGKLERREMYLAVSSFTVLEAVSLLSFYINNKLNVLRNGYSSGFYLGILAFVLIVAAGVVRQWEDIRHQAFRAAFLERRAYTDDLTGLLNVKGFDDKCAHLLSGAPDGECRAVVDFDVNFFSQYNATNGVEAGDELLQSIARTLRACCRTDELIARQEADHFVCLLRGGSLAEIIARIRAANRGAHGVLTSQQLLISYGVAEATGGEQSVTALRNQAVVAKRTVKGNYEKTIAVYDRKLHDQQLREVALLSGFEQALENRDYVFFLQPKIVAATGALGGAEALVRRVEPNGSVTPAGPIIEALERKGFVAKLDDYILDLVCAFLRRCLNENRAPCAVSVNFSRVHLFDPEFVTRVCDTVDRYALPHRLVEIELTESVFLAGKELLRTAMKRLHENGFRVSIDDFGSGYSSLNLLKDVEADVIKLDREFLADFVENRRAGVIVEHTLRLAQEMGISTVAEGVETWEQLQFLRANGCDLVQGFYYSRPLPVEAFLTAYLPPSSSSSSSSGCSPRPTCAPSMRTFK